jgi:hypothetical protein
MNRFPSRFAAGFLALFAIAFLFAAHPAFAQSTAACNAAVPAVCSLYPPTSAFQIKPQAVPTAITAVTLYDAYLQTVTITNTTSGALTFTLADRQGTPVAVLSAISVAANTTYVVVFPSFYWCPNGFTVIASGSGLNYYAAGRL